MEIYNIIILGILQGVTEFLPVSSSGHLVIAQYFLGVNFYGNNLEILFHFGTLLSVVFVFFNDIKQLLFSLNEKDTQILILYIVIATIPASVVGLFLKNYIVKFFDNISFVGFALCFTGIILSISNNFQNNQKNFSLLSSILVGIAQAIAIVPGVSRSGLTISMSMYLGISSKDAAKFSFLISIPIILGASILNFIEMDKDNIFTITSIITAIVSSFLTGVFALKFLLKILEIGKFYIFGLYCICIGLCSIIL